VLSQILKENSKRKDIADLVLTTTLIVTTTGENVFYRSSDKHIDIIKSTNTMDKDTLEI